MEKLTGKLAIRLAGETEEILTRLAKINGMNPSDYAREVLIRHLEQEREKYLSLKRIFGPINPESDS